MANYYSDQMKHSELFGWHVYVLSMPGFSKIGTAANVLYRVAGIQCGNPYALNIEAIWHFKGRDQAMLVERVALSDPAVKRITNRDWCECHGTVALLAVASAIQKLKYKANRLPLPIGGA